MKGKQIQLITICSLLFISLSLAGTSQSATPVAPVAESEAPQVKVYRQTPDGEGHLTEQMIETCILSKQGMDTEYGVINEMKPKLDLFSQEIAKLKKHIDGDIDEMDFEDPLKEFSHEEKVKMHRAKIVEHNELLKEYNAKADVYKPKAEKFNKDCKDQPYYEDDYKKVVEKVGFGL